MRTTRFIIDKIDAKLGDPEKEKTFDLAVIALGVLAIAVGIFLASTMIDKNNRLAVVGFLLLLVGFSLVYVMTKEFIADCKKTKK